MLHLPSPKAARALIRTDALRLARDRFLVGAAVYILALSVVMRFALPWVRQAVLERQGPDLAAHFPMMVSYLTVVMGAVMIGIIGGFLLLETREDGTIRALLVSPVSLSGYLLMACALLTAATGALILTEALIVDLGLPPTGPLLLSAALGAPSGAAVALALASLAHTKVEAFAWMKFISFLGFIPVALWFLPPAYHPIGAVFPPFSACKIWWLAQAGDPSWWWWTLPAALASALWLGALLRYAHHVAYRA